MTRDELVNFLGTLDVNLRSSQVQFFFQNRPQPDRDRFVFFRQEVTFLEGKLSNAQLASIAGKLDELSNDIGAGINQLQGKEPRSKLRGIHLKQFQLQRLFV